MCVFLSNLWDTHLDQQQLVGGLMDSKYKRVVIELEFDEDDEITQELIVDYIRTLYINNELYVEAFNADHSFSHLVY